jgi:putative ABC transport system ATP-binding protein
MAKNDPGLPEQSDTLESVLPPLEVNTQTLSDGPITQPIKSSTRVTENLTLDASTEHVIARAGQAASLGRPVIRVRNLTKTYQAKMSTPFTALRNISLEIQRGEFVAIMGPSGSGKSTLMNLLGCLDTPTSGEYTIDGHLVNNLSSDQLAHIRNQTIGFVFQNFNLLPRATALKNVELPMMYARYSRQERERRSRQLLKLVGMEARMLHKPSELSGGQQQRVAIARALVNGPSLLLADEPSGNLDSKTSTEIMSVLQTLNEQGMTIVLITHDYTIAHYAKRLVQLLDGEIISDQTITEPRSALEDWQTIEQMAASENTFIAAEQKV